MFKMNKVVDYETYQQGLEILKEKYFSIGFILFLLGVVAFSLYVIFNKKRITDDKLSDHLFWLVVVLVVIVIGTFVGYHRKVIVFKEEVKNTPGIIYKWETQKTFKLEEVKIQLKKEADTDFLLTINSVERDQIDVDAVFNIDQGNTVIHVVEKPKGQVIILEKRVLKDSRFKELIREKQTSLIFGTEYYTPAEKVRWVFYVNEENKNLLNLQNIRF